MPIAFKFREMLGGLDWAVSRWFVVNEFESLYASLGPLAPLIDGLQTGFAAATGAGYAPGSVLTTDVAGVPSLTRTLPMPLAFASGAVVTVGALIANANDYNPVGLPTAAVLRLSSSAAFNITGLAQPAIPCARLLVNAGAFPLTLTHADGASQMKNQFRCPGGVNFSLVTFAAVWVWYDVASPGWQVI